MFEVSGPAHDPIVYFPLHDPTCRRSCVDYAGCRSTPGTVSLTTPLAGDGI